MTDSGGLQKRLSLSAGGLLYLAQRWIHGPESPDFPIPVQMLTAIALLWLPLVILSLFEGSLTGTEVAQPLFADIVPHVRFLIAIPLLLLADLVIDPSTSAATRNLESGGIVPHAEQPRFQEALTDMRRGGTLVATKYAADEQIEEYAVGQATGAQVITFAGKEPYTRARQ